MTPLAPPAAQSGEGIQDIDTTSNGSRSPRATLIYNPTAGHGASATDLAAAQEVLIARGWTLRSAATTAPGSATALAREAVERGDDVVVVAGGDGTINEAIQALAGTTVALGALPVGTVNVWAREVGLPSHPVAAAAALADGEYRTIDLGRAGERHFLLMAGAGFDGAVTGVVEPGLKRAMGRWAYVIAAIRLALRYGGADAALEMDGGTVRCRLWLAVIGNTRLYAGQLTLTASAVADDGLLDVVIFPGRRLWQALPRLLVLLVRRGPLGPGVLYYRTRRLRITTAEGLAVQADGDYIGATPMDFSIAPAALRVVVPRGARTPLFQLPRAGHGERPHPPTLREGATPFLSPRPREGATPSSSGGEGERSGFPILRVRHMRRLLRRLMALGLAAVAVLGLAGCATQTTVPDATTTPTAATDATVTPAPDAATIPAAQPTPPAHGVAAVVNGERVPTWEFEALLQLNQQNSGVASTPPSSTAAAAVRAHTVRQIVDEALLNAYAQAHDLAVAPAEVDARLEVYRMQAGAGFAASLARLGVTAAQLRRMVARNLNVQAVTQRLINGIAAPPVRVQVVQIVVASPQQAERVRAELLRGTDATLVAVRESSDPVLRRLAGQVPPLTATEGNRLYGAAWSAVAFALQPGQTSQPIRLRDGWAVLHMVERQPAAALMQGALDGFIARLRRTAKITVYVH